MPCPGPSVDVRCEDEAFALANPELCTDFARLYLVPNNSIIEPGDTVEYSVILRQGAKEFVITLGLLFSSANVGVAVVNSLGGATGVLAGETTITVTWQNLTAHATIQVVASCTEVNTDYLILIDNSKSMTVAAYTAASRLAYAKSAANQFCDAVNYSKDRVGVMKFNDDADSVIGFQITAPPAKAAISSITSTVFKTDIATALQEASDYFGAQGSTGVRAIILFSDGEQNDGSDPVLVARAFKDAGGFIIVIATRAWGVHFELLNQIASPGFFLSAHATTEAEIPGSLAALKSLICGGDCQPEPGTHYEAVLNYDAFINWDVTAGRVDLIGLGLWDVQAGNGLYVDLQGSNIIQLPDPGEDFGLGQITSKDEFTFTAGKAYRLSLKVGGSSVDPILGTWTIRIRAGDELDETVTIVVGNQPFALSTFNWTVASTHTGPVIIEQIVQSAHHNVGTLIDVFTLQNITDSNVMLFDDFDEENPVVTPPGGTSAYGCIEGPLDANIADDTPPAVIVEGS